MDKIYWLYNKEDIAAIRNSWIMLEEVFNSMLSIKYKYPERITEHMSMKCFNKRLRYCARLLDEAPIEDKEYNK